VTRRVHADLAACGVPAGPELVRSVMRELGLEPCQPRPWRFSLTEDDGREHAIPDLVERDFTAGAPGQKMVGDITCIPTWQGWLYLAIIDCHTKAVIGWATGDNYKTPLIGQAIEMAARNCQLAAGAVFHSGRGSNYTSREFTRTLERYNLRQSVGRTGICYDNAMAESFFAALKNERVHRTEYPTREHARQATAALRPVAICPAGRLARCRFVATDVIGKLDEIPVGIAEVDAHHVSVSSGLLDWSDFDCHPGCRELRLYAVEVVIDDQA
jgi:putative transposase